MNQEPPLYDYMLESAAFLKKKGIGQVDVGMILGSGLSGVGESLDKVTEIRYDEIPHMIASGAPGHRGVLKYGKLGDDMVLIFSGRLHYYEGHAMWQISYPIRILQALGVQHVLITAAVGGLSDRISGGDIMLITDHINLMPENPIRGLSDPRLGERFPEMSRAYDDRWNNLIGIRAQAAGFNLKRGVYAGLAGPNLETQAECVMLRGAGADVVGMSVVPEVIVAAQAGIRVAALCAVANMAWHPGERIGAGTAEILAAAHVVSERLGKIILKCCFPLP